MIALESHNLKLGYRHKIAVHNASVSIEDGSFVAIIGPNGSGKSTLLKGLSRLLKPLSGSVKLFGKPISQMATKEIAKTIAMLPQRRSVNTDVSVETLVSYGRHPHLKFGQRIDAKNQEIIDWAIDTVRMGHLRHRFVSTLSGGEAQRAWIAMALAQKPRILMLDEPTTFLDISHQFDVLQTVQDLNKQLGITVIAVLHDLNQAARYAGHVCAVKQGEIILDAHSSEIMDNKFLRKAFSIEGDILPNQTNGCDYFIPQKVYF